jgi:hypothetical protein
MLLALDQLASVDATPAGLLQPLNSWWSQSLQIWMMIFSSIFSKSLSLSLLSHLAAYLWIACISNCCQLQLSVAFIFSLFITFVVGCSFSFYEVNDDDLLSATSLFLLHRDPSFCVTYLCHVG